MFEKNADRPNLQSWVSAGFNAGKVTSQTDVWYSSSDAFYMYQAENDKKVYTQEANPWLDHETQCSEESLGFLALPMEVDTNRNIAQREGKNMP